MGPSSLVLRGPRTTWTPSLDHEPSTEGRRSIDPKTPYGTGCAPRFQRPDVGCQALAVSPAGDDAGIRPPILLYDELIAEVADALGHAGRPGCGIVVDLGIGTGALARACLRRASRRARLGIDADPDMMAIACTRLGRLSRRVTMTRGSFLDEALPPCDAIVASYSLHHIRTPRAKLAFYRRCYRALRPGGVLINGDCAPASTRRGFSRDLDLWFSHLGKTFGGRARGRRVYESWADEGGTCCSQTNPPAGARRLRRGRAVAPLAVRGHRGRR